MSTTGAAYDEFVFTTGDELWDRVHQAHRRFAALLSVTPCKTEVPGSEWNAGQVAAHVLTVLRRYTQRDIRSPEGLSPSADAVAASAPASSSMLMTTAFPLSAASHIGVAP